MNPIDEPLPWRISEGTAYTPLEYDGETIGYCNPEYAEEIVAKMNDRLVLEKALRMACRDLLRRMNRDASRANDLAKRYLQQAKRPTTGPRALAYMLIDRQRELGLSQAEFFKFCDTFKVSSQDIAAMAEGATVPEGNIAPISRVLGITPTEVEAILNPG